jgi:hypothetical protein
MVFRNKVWDNRWEQLVEYKQANGDCNVSRSDQNMELVRWVARQRYYKKNSQLSVEREAKLNSIGFVWSTKYSVTDWNERFRQLVDYKQAVGDCNVPKHGNPQLGQWMKAQRHAQKTNALTNERWEKLNSIGFDWKLMNWDARLEQLVEYKNANGDCNIPAQYSQNMELVRWVSAQRQAKKTSQQKFKLSAERQAKLDAIRVILIDWETHFEQLKEYKKVNGDCNVSRVDPQNMELGGWVSAQRQAKKTFQLSDEREAKLNAIGFVWNIKSSNVYMYWNVRFQQLLEYKQVVGDCNVPIQYFPNLQLGRWVQAQRQANKNQKLTKEHWEQLNSIGFGWGKQPSGRTARNQQLEKYIERTHHGLCDTDLPERCSGNNPPHLHKLVTEHRFNNTPKEVLEKESVAEIKTSDEQNCWDVHFRELLVYLQTHGDFNVPHCCPRNPLLARWVSEQRNDYDLKRRGEQTSLTPLREAKLDAIGFTWFVGVTTIKKEDVPSAMTIASCVPPTRITPSNNNKMETLGACQKKDNTPATEDVLSSASAMPIASYRGPPARPSNSNNKNNNKTAIRRPYQTTEWNKRFQQLVAYKEANGDCNVQQTHSINPQLATWADTQRKGKRNGTLKVERETQLNAVGFFWFRRKLKSPCH